MTESQFHRSFPGPADVTEHEMRQIAGHYRDPKTGLYNYLRFHADIELLGQEESDRNPLGDPRPPSAKVCSICWSLGLSRYDVVYPCTHMYVCLYV